MEESLQQGLQGGMPNPQGAPMGEMQSSAPAPADAKEKLKEMMSAVDQKMMGLTDKMTEGDQISEEQKMEVLSYLFEMLQERGIDPGDQEAVSAFLEELKQINPDLFGIFESIIDSVLGEEGGEMEEEGAIPPAQNFPNLAGGSEGMMPGMEEMPG
jgi:hypothetical protein